MDHFIQALVFIVNTIKKYCYFPGFIEKYSLMVDVKDCGVTEFPFAILKSLISVTGNMFPSSMYHIFIVNPSYSLRFTWAMVESKY